MWEPSRRISESIVSNLYTSFTINLTPESSVKKSDWLRKCFPQRQKIYSSNDFILAIVSCWKCALFFSIYVYKETCQSQGFLTTANVYALFQALSPKYFFTLQAEAWLDGAKLEETPSAFPRSLSNRLRLINVSSYDDSEFLMLVPAFLNIWIKTKFLLFE